MKLIQLKIRGLGTVPQTEWIKLGPAINVLQIDDRGAGTGLLEAIETINPVVDCRRTDPFRQYPHHERRNGYLRVVDPRKRSVAIAVFDTSAPLVAELGAITPVLYETDRVEVGRRLDYSRWYNFVEIASSTRWSEIAADVEELLAAGGAAGKHVETVRNMTSRLEPVDRVKGTVAAELERWLDEIEKAGSGPAERLDSVREKVRRAHYFTTARATIAEKLPLIVPVHPATLGSSTVATVAWPEAKVDGDELNRMAEQMKTELFPVRTPPPSNRSGPGKPAKAHIGKAASGSARVGIERFCAGFAAVARLRGQAPPIFLFDLLESGSPPPTSPPLASLLRQLSAHCQCLCITDKEVPEAAAGEIEVFTPSNYLAGRAAPGQPG